MSGMLSVVFRRELGLFKPLHGKTASPCTAKPVEKAQTDARCLAGASVARAIRSVTVFEQDTIDFYEFLASFLDDPRAMEQMRRIIDQEREHVRQLEAVRAEGAPPEMGSA